MDDTKRLKCWNCGNIMCPTLPNQDRLAQMVCKSCGTIIGPVIEDGKVFPTSHPKVLDALADAIGVVVDYMYDEEKHFKEVEEPNEHHIYRQVLALQAWLTRYRDSGMDAPEIDYFGGCPECRDCDANLNVRSCHWHVCHLHHVRWCIGSNLFSAWKEEDENTWQFNAALLQTYREVKPVTSLEYVARIDEDPEQQEVEGSCFICI